MTADRMQRQQGSPWLTFWENLKEAYDLFEHHGRPANVLVQSQRYRFE